MSLGAAVLSAAGLRSIGVLQGARGWLCHLLSQSADPQCPTWNLTFQRRKHIVPEQRPASVVPEAILRELNQINSYLGAESQLDGRLRSSLVLSAQSLPGRLPDHEVEPDLPSLEAHVRPPEGMARCAVKWLRRSGRVPGHVFSLSSGRHGGVWEMNVHFDEKELTRMVRTFGRNGCTARVLKLKLMRPPPPPPARNGSDSDSNACSSSSRGSNSSSDLVDSVEQLLGVVRVKPVRVHLNAVTQRLENIELLYCPVDRVVVVDVPVRLLNDEMAPGVRKGGWMSMYKRTVRYKALGNAIPPFIEVNVRHLDLEQDLLVRDLPIPPGTKIYEKNYNAPVVRCTMDVGKD